MRLLRERKIDRGCIGVWIDEVFASIENDHNIRLARTEKNELQTKGHIEETRLKARENISYMWKQKNRHMA